MLCVKHCIVSAAGLFGGVFGYVSAETDTWTLIGAFIGMFMCAAAADTLTMTLEENEDGDD